MIYDDVSTEDILDTINKTEEYAIDIEGIVMDIIRPYCQELDNYVYTIKSILADSTKPPTEVELDDFCMNLSTFIYIAGGMCEQLGIRDDIAKAVYKEVYNNARDSQEKGTVADKNTLAELASQEEQLSSVCYTRAYKIMKAKVENAQELLSSCKKVLTRRMNERELTRIGG